jgi:hypothetical protein
MNKTYPLLTILAAASRAAKINGDYIKFPVVEIRDNDDKVLRQARETNRFIVAQLLESQENILDEDYSDAQVFRTFIQGLSLKILQKGSLSPFEHKLYQIADLEEVSADSVAMLAYTPYMYKQYEEKDYAETKRLYAANSHIGNINEKITTKVEVTKVVRSIQFGCFFIEGVTDANNKVFFSHKNQLEMRKIYCIEGKVKAHKPDYLTQLNYVKLRQAIDNK